MRCASCQAELATPSRFCPHCGAAATDQAATATMSMGPRPSYPRPPSSSSASSEEGRFPAGALLGERYRILGLLGRGGMGEVYRASDLKLNQPVALKFLPDATARNPRLLERFHGEVRIARQVSHPNVCRVYDIGEASGTAYISMEYVDGEDLGSLLRRIGRLPGDKAIEIARKLCAGLAAAHAKGVLHRDLKPANVMIDGRGQVLIMDFGLAAIADQVEGAEVRNGTPAYMAPEQIAGREVTARSDIYSLGLVLFEVFTGQRAYKSADRTAMPSAASMVKDIDPVIERVISRCLDPDPAKRPQTALALARMLPGGDPLAEALAAGDTPSPEMVAASDDTGALSVRWAVVSMAVVVVGLIALLLLSSRVSVFRLTPFPNSREILAREAREISARMGYAAPVDEEYVFGTQGDYMEWAEGNLSPEEYHAQVAKGQPAPVLFFYRQSPRYMEPEKPSGRISADDPPFTVSGMVEIHLDPQARLVFFRAVPPQLVSADQSSPPPSQPMDWNKLFAAAGLDPSQWTPAEPQEIPLFSFDERKAWTGVFAHASNMPMRIEAAAWKGRPVAFEVFGPWRVPARQQSAQQTAGERIVIPVLLSVVSILTAGALLLAWRNFRQGRGDLQGARRLAAVTLASGFLGNLLRIHHVPTSNELFHGLNALSTALVVGALVWVLWVALEPYLRRRWPQSLISWTRLLAGDFRDPVVAGHILAGTALGVVIALAFGAANLFAYANGVLTVPPDALVMLEGTGLAQSLLGAFVVPPALAMGGFFLFFLLRVLLRNTWVAVAISVALFVAGMGGPRLLSLPVVVFAAVTSSVSLWVLLRFGILPFAVILMATYQLSNAPLTSDLSAWYADKGLVVVALLLVLAIWSFRNALGGRSVLKGDVLEG